MGHHISFLKLQSHGIQMIIALSYDLVVGSDDFQQWQHNNRLNNHNQFMRDQFTEPRVPLRCVLRAARRGVGVEMI